MNAIVVFGEALVDDFLTEQVVGGAPFNVARHLAAFGQQALMVTRIGTDEAGLQVQREFDRFGMSRDGLQIDAVEPTGRVVVERSECAHRFNILPDQAYDHIAPHALAATPSLIYFGTLVQRSATSRAALHQLLGASGACRYLDLNVREGQVSERCVYKSLHEADIVKVNEDELQDLFSWYNHVRHDTGDMESSAVRTACAALIRFFALETLIVTLGPRGAVCFQKDGQFAASTATTPPSILVDTVGAGDAFSAVFLLGRERGWPLQLALTRANEFAGAICGVAGAVPNDLAFYEPWLARWMAH